MTEPTKPAQPLARLQKHGLRATRALDVRAKEVDVRFEAPAQLNIASMQIHKSVSVGAYTSLHSGGLIKVDSIGRYCSIGRNVVLGEPAYDMGWLCTSRVFSAPDSYKWYVPEKEQVRTRRRLRRANAADRPVPGPVTIGNDVRIGANAVVREGVRIGDGAIIAPGADVDADVEPYAIVSGVPARLIGKRFDDATIQALMDLRWWEFNLDDLYGVSFEDPSKAIPMLREKELAGLMSRWPVAYGTATITREGFTGLSQPSRPAAVEKADDDAVKKAAAVKSPRKPAKEPLPEIADVAVAALAVEAVAPVAEPAPEGATPAQNTTAPDAAVGMASSEPGTHREIAEAPAASASPEQEAASSEASAEHARDDVELDEVPGVASDLTAAAPAHADGEPADSAINHTPSEVEAASPVVIAGGSERVPAEVAADASAEVSHPEPGGHEEIAQTTVGTLTAAELQTTLAQRFLEPLANDWQQDQAPAATSDGKAPIHADDVRDEADGGGAAPTPLDLDAGGESAFPENVADRHELEEMTAGVSSETAAAQPSAHDDVAAAMVAALASSEFEAAFADETFEEPSQTEPPALETQPVAPAARPDAHDEIADAVIAALDSVDLEAKPAAASASPEDVERWQEPIAESAEAARPHPTIHDEVASGLSAEPGAVDISAAVADVPATRATEDERMPAPSKPSAHDDIAEALVAALASRELEAALSGYQAAAPADTGSTDTSEDAGPRTASPIRRRLGDWSLGLTDSAYAAPTVPSCDAEVEPQPSPPRSTYERHADPGDQPDPSARSPEEQAGDDQLMETVLAALTFEGLDPAIEDHRKGAIEHEDARSNTVHDADEAQIRDDGETIDSATAAELPAAPGRDDGGKPGRARFVFPWSR